MGKDTKEWNTNADIMLQNEVIEYDFKEKERIHMTGCKLKTGNIAHWYTETLVHCQQTYISPEFTIEEQRQVNGVDLIRVKENGKGRLCIKFHNTNGLIYVNGELFNKWANTDYFAIKHAVSNSTDMLMLASSQSTSNCDSLSDSLVDLVDVIKNDCSEIIPSGNVSSSNVNCTNNYSDLNTSITSDVEIVQSNKPEQFDNFISSVEFTPKASPCGQTFVKKRIITEMLKIKICHHWITQAVLILMIMPLPM